MSQPIRTSKQLGALVRDARTRQNLTQQALADLIGTGQKTISRIETGHDGARLDTLLAITAALGLDLGLGPRAKGNDISDIF